MDDVTRHRSWPARRGSTDCSRCRWPAVRFRSPHPVRARRQDKLSFIPSIWNRDRSCASCRRCWGRRERSSWLSSRRSTSRWCRTHLSPRFGAAISRDHGPHLRFGGLRSDAGHHGRNECPAQMAARQRRRGCDQEQVDQDTDRGHARSPETRSKAASDAMAQFMRDAAGGAVKDGLQRGLDKLLAPINPK